MSATTRPLGPGPGAYALPQLVGFKDHDTRKLRMPQYSFGSKPLSKYGSEGPGPGAYGLEGVTRNGAGKTPAFSFGLKLKAGAYELKPGPGAHDNHNAPIFKGIRPPAYSMAKRLHMKPADINPGPSAYFGNLATIKPKEPSYSMARRLPIPAQYNSPGPAAYGPIEPCVTKLCPPKYSATQRRPEMKGRDIVPAPDNYNLQDYKPGKKPPKYSFGVRHSPYSPPMIVECDNY